MSLPQRKFTNWLAAYHEYTSQSEAPARMHFWTGVSTIAGALRRRVWIEQRYFQWTPNFYIVFVGPPGVVTKSTSVRIGAQLLKQVPGIHFGPNSLTWQALAKSLQEAQTLVKYKEGPDGEHDFLPMACITCSINELGTFLTPSEAKLVDVFTDLWDGQKEAWEHGTATQGSTKIENPWLNVITATTPAWLSQNFPEAMVGGGLASRMIFVYADKKRHYIAYPGLAETPEKYQALEKELVHDLQIIAQLIGEYVIEVDAIEWGINWYENLWKHRPEHLSSIRYGGYIARKQTHIHKLAIVLAASQRNELVITKEDLMHAEQCVTSLEDNMLTVFESVGASKNARHMKEIAAHINVRKEISRTELWTKVCNNISPTEYGEAVDSLAKAGYIKIFNNGKDLIYRAVEQAAKAGD